MCFVLAYFLKFLPLGDRLVVYVVKCVVKPLPLAVGSVKWHFNKYLCLFLDFHIPMIQV